MTRGRRKNLQELVSQALETPEEAMPLISLFAAEDKRWIDSSFVVPESVKKEYGGNAAYDRMTLEDLQRRNVQDYKDFSKNVKWLSNPKPSDTISGEEGQRILRYLAHRKGTSFTQRSMFIDAKVRYYTQLKDGTGITNLIKDRPWYEAIREPSIENRYPNMPPFDIHGGEYLKEKDYRKIIIKAREQLPRIYKMVQREKSLAHQTHEFRTFKKVPAYREFRLFLRCGNYLAQQRTLTESEWNALAKMKEGARYINDRNHKRIYR